MFSPLASVVSLADSRQPYKFTKLLLPTLEAEVAASGLIFLSGLVKPLENEGTAPLFVGLTPLRLLLGQPFTVAKGLAEDVLVAVIPRFFVNHRQQPIFRQIACSANRALQKVLIRVARFDSAVVVGQNRN